MPGFAPPQTAAGWLTAGLTHAAAATALAAGVYVLTRFWRNPHAGRALWGAVVLKLLCPPLLAVAVALPTFAPATNRDRQGAAPSTPEPIVTAADPVRRWNRDLQGAALPTVAPRDTPPILIEAAPPAPAAAPTPRTRTETLPDGRGSIDPAAAVLAVWLAGTIFLWTLAAARAWRFGRRVRRLPDAGEDLTARLAAAAASMNVAAPRLKVSDAVGPLVWAGPVRFGRFGRPVVVVPGALADGLADAAAGALLAHECAHLARRDELWRWLELGVCGAWWWLPTAWLAASAGRRCEELCCDAAVLESRRDSPDPAGPYAAALLAAAEFLQRNQRKRVPSPASGVGRPAFLKRRFEMICQNALPRRPARGVRYGVFTAAACAVAVGVTFARDDPPAAADPPAADPPPVPNARPAGGFRVLNVDPEDPRVSRLNAGETDFFGLTGRRVAAAESSDADVVTAEVLPDGRVRLTGVAPGAARLFLEDAGGAELVAPVGVRRFVRERPLSEYVREMEGDARAAAGPAAVAAGTLRDLAGGLGLELADPPVPVTLEAAVGSLNESDFHFRETNGHPPLTVQQVRAEFREAVDAYDEFGTIPHLTAPATPETLNGDVAVVVGAAHREQAEALRTALETGSLPPPMKLWLLRNREGVRTPVVIFGTVRSPEGEWPVSSLALASLAQAPAAPPAAADGPARPPAAADDADGPAPPVAAPADAEATFDAALAAVSSEPADEPQRAVLLRAARDWKLDAEIRFDALGRVTSRELIRERADALWSTFGSLVDLAEKRLGDLPADLESWKTGRRTAEEQALVKGVVLPLDRAALVLHMLESVGAPVPDAAALRRLLRFSERDGWEKGGETMISPNMQGDGTSNLRATAGTPAGVALLATAAREEAARIAREPAPPYKSTPARRRLWELQGAFADTSRDRTITPALAAALGELTDDPDGPLRKVAMAQLVSARIAPAPRETPQPQNTPQPAAPAAGEAGLSPAVRERIAAALRAAADDDELPPAARRRMILRTVEPGELTPQQTAVLFADLSPGDGGVDGVVETLSVLNELRAVAPDPAAARRVAAVMSYVRRPGEPREGKVLSGGTDLLNRTAGTAAGLRTLLAAARQAPPEPPAAPADRPAGDGGMGGFGNAESMISGMGGPGGRMGDYGSSMADMMSGMGGRRAGSPGDRFGAATAILLDAVRRSLPLTDDAAQVLLEAAGSDDPAVRAAAVEALARAGGE